MPTTTIDPDRGGEVVFKDSPHRNIGGDDEGRVAGPNLTCDDFGGFGTAFQFANRYRGNLYRITKPEVVLQRIQMQLAFSGTANLYVSIHQRQDDDTYLRISPDFVIMNAVGLGLNTPALYSTGLLNNGDGIPLAPGDYAIAFAWGGTTVVYGRDSLTYPRAFRHGSTMGSVALTVPTGTIPPQPPLDDSLPPLQVFTNGAYAMLLCFKPLPGACCSGGTCADKFASQCSGAGSYFHGERTTCAETPCAYGACCTNKCGGCSGNYTPEACLAVGGQAHWVGAACSNPTTGLCPKVTGACCTGVSCNDTMCETECLAAGGTWRGDGSKCTPNICQGACCVTGGCLDRTPSGCAGLNGTYKGDGTTCATLPIEQQCGGACCYGFSPGTVTNPLEFCENVAYRALCAYDPNGFPYIAYRGDGTTCNTGSCGQITNYTACCLPQGACINTTPSVCASTWIQGVAISGFRCETLAAGTCPNLVNRCCFGDGSCEPLTGTACSARGGTTIAGQTSCSGTPCASFGGACCGTATGACTMTTGAQCAAQGGLYQGDSSNCNSPAATCPGFGACCKANGDCFDDFTAAHCALIAGAFKGAGSECDPPPVNCDERGPCCTTTGQCLFVDLATCNEVGGTFGSVGTPCTANFCVSGACCIGTNCVQRTASACAAQSGVYRGNDTVCETDTCDPTGGCCLIDGCATRTKFACANLGGDYLGDGAGCSAGSCDIGACCLSDGQCEDGARSGACQQPGQTFHLGETCGGGTFVCLAPPTGACCTGSNCETKTEAECNAGGGIYKGNDVPCTPNPCGPTCTTIVSSDPANCAIDARRPHAPGNPGALQGWNSITLTFDCGDTSVLTAGQFSVTTTPSGTAPTVSSVTPNGASITLNLSGPIPAGAWTCVAFTPTQSRRCLGFLPADVNSNRTAAPGDILELIDHLNNVRQPPLVPHQCDTDRSNLCAPSDILTEIDLLNGASGFSVWNGRTLPVCPSAGP